jgi:flagellin
MSATGLGVSTVDVTGVGAYTNGAAGAGKVSTTNAGAANAELTITAVSGDPTADVAVFEGLDGTISFGGKSFDLRTVDYSDATTGAEALTALNTAAKSALGLASDPFTATATTVVFQVNDAVAGYTGAAGAALNGATATAAEVAKATPTFSAASGASEAITDIDDAIKTVSTTRANLGALQNRFEHTINNLNVAVENLSASESRIRDTDMAAEMMNFTRSQILSQAGTAMLAQANQAPQGVLSLLR